MLIMGNGRITARQELFASEFSLCGNGTRAALRAGCRTPNAAHVQASRWLQKATIQNRIIELREIGFRDIRDKVARELLGAVSHGFKTNTRLKETARAIRLMHRLGMFPYDPFARGERAEPEIRFNEEQCSRILELAENARLRESQRTEAAEG